MNFHSHKNNRFFLFGGVAVFSKILFAVILLQATAVKAAPAPESFADLADQLLPAVVNISSTQKINPQQQFQMSPYQNQNPFQFPEGSPFNDFFNDFFGQPMPGMPMQELPATSLGSGFIIDISKGIVITNNHVIAGADEIKVTLHNDKILPAEIIGSDDKTDIAVLKVDLTGEEHVAEVKFGNSDEMRVGDWVIAIGNPFGLGGTVTAGIISARQRDINMGPYDDLLQTDASINRGNSGGPMFNMKGEVIGINTAIFSPTGGSVGIGFATPSAQATPVIKQLNQFGRTRRGWLGVKIQDVTEEIAESLGLAKSAGALVAEITPTGPAEKAGIRTGDVILAFDNKPVREMRQLPRIVAETDINSDVPIVIWRNGERVNLTANIGELEKAEDDGLLAAHDGDNMFPGDKNKVEGTEIPTLGITVNPLTDILRQTFSVDKSVSGLVVMDTNANGDAAKKGITAGDVIIDANQKPATIESLQQEIESAQKAGRESILLLLNRQGSIQFVAVRLEVPKPEKETDAETGEQPKEEATPAPAQ